MADEDEDDEDDGDNDDDGGGGDGGGDGTNKHCSYRDRAMCVLVCSFYCRFGTREQSKERRGEQTNDKLTEHVLQHGNKYHFICVDRSHPWDVKHDLVGKRSLRRHPGRFEKRRNGRRVRAVINLGGASGVPAPLRSHVSGCQSRGSFWSMWQASE